MDEFRSLFGSQKSCRFLISVENSLNIHNVITEFAKYDIKSIVVSNYSECIDTAVVYLVHFSIPTPFVHKDLFCIPCGFIFSDGRFNNNQNANKLQTLVREIENFDIGCYVIHRAHGKCIFNGLKDIVTDGIKHECFELQFENGKLLLPIDRFDLIAKAPNTEDEVLIDKIGSAAWQRKRERIKTRITAISGVIANLAAQRQSITTDDFSLSISSNSYRTFENNFLFLETQDQLSAIDDIKKDILAGHPMNRIICGDTGFGKTEVAMRAVAMIVCGKNENNILFGQVCFVCPTQTLANQHYKSFVRRFKCLEKIKIELLTSKTQKAKREEILSAVKNGDIDVLIGTHSVLSKNIEFQNLCMIIIDEEQIFGVEQKEKMKSRYPAAHVIYISATPIPRTLYQGLNGLCDMSLITTPPGNRKITDVKIQKYKTSEISQIINREIQNKGNVLIISPRIEYIQDIKNYIANINANWSIETIDGRMNREMIEERIENFDNKNVDILISTTICAFGVDFEYTNTILVFYPELFGVGQLYQIKGRVGRRDKRGVCCFVVSDKVFDDEDKMRRLRVIKDMNNFGAGFGISMHDADMRGVGNLFGTEQSGDICDIGVEMYQEILAEVTTQTPVLQLQMDVTHYSYCIPDNYIHNPKTKISFYRRIGASLSDEELNNITAELKNRFGDMPVECNNLIYFQSMKNYCECYGVTSIVLSKKSVRLCFGDIRYVDPKKMLTLHGKELKILPNNCIEILFDNLDEILPKLKNIFEN